MQLLNRASEVTIRYVLEELAVDHPHMDVDALYDRFMTDAVLAHGILRDWHRARGERWVK